MNFLKALQSAWFAGLAHFRGVRSRQRRASTIETPF